jgi:glycosyltransferase involved in cell wall biosynthesis
MGLKVLMIGTYPVEPGVVVGGVESAMSVLVRALAERDDIDSVTVLRFHHGEAPTGYRREAAKVEVHYVRGQYRWRMLTGGLLDVRKARGFVAALRPDVVHGQGIGMDGDIAARCSPSCVVTVHGISYVETQLFDEPGLRTTLRAKLLQYVAYRVLHRAKVVISISEYDAGELDGLTRGTRMSIANATAAEFFALAPPTPTEPRLLFAGGLVPLKNPLGLVNAFAEVRRMVPGARLALAGPEKDPAYAKIVRDRVTALGLDDNVEFVGYVGIERMRQEIASARAVVLFSRQENAPTVIAQAMAAGKPVVASRVGGVPEMVDDGETGFLVDSEDEVALADRLVTVLDDQQLCLRMGRRGHEIALARFAPEAVAEMTVDAYRTAMMRSCV